MELLQYKYHDAYIIQASSTDIGLSWRKFKVRAKQLSPEAYCNYEMESGGALQVYNADTQQMKRILETDSRHARTPKDSKRRITASLSYQNAQTETRRQRNH